MSGKTFAIKIFGMDERFFCGVGKGGRVKTAWCFAGAKLFLDGDEKLEKIVKMLEAKKKRFSVIDVSVGQDYKEWTYRQAYLTQVTELLRLTRAIRSISYLGEEGKTEEMVTRLSNLRESTEYNDIPF